LRPQVAAGVVLVCGLLSLASPARADRFEAALVRAVALKEQALDARDNARWMEVLRAFQAAEEQRATPEVLYEIGFAAERLRQDDLACESYEAALSLGLTGPARDKASAFVSRHEGELARVRIEGPEGARIYVAGVVRGTLPLLHPLRTFAGPTRVLVTLPDGRERSRDVHLVAGEDALLDFTESVPVAPAADIAVEPAPTGAAPLPQAQAPSGAASRLSVPRPSPAAQRSPVPLVLIVAGGGLALAGAVIVPVSYERLAAERGDLTHSCAERSGRDVCLHAAPGRVEAAQSDVDAIATWKGVRTAALVGGISGVAAAALGFAVRFGDAHHAEATALRATPFGGCSSTGCSLGVLGAF
jgi:hypothetical protein